jgi:hypothetical protein
MISRLHRPSPNHDLKQWLLEGTVQEIEGPHDSLEGPPASVVAGDVFDLRR